MMEQITIEELEKKLENWENETIMFDLTGLVSTEVKIGHSKTTNTQEDITIKNKENEEEKVILNKYQIMKIVKDEDKEDDECFLVKFDDLQMVRICRYQELDI